MREIEFPSGSAKTAQLMLQVCVIVKHSIASIC